MQNLVNFIDIPSKDFNRAVSFYRAILRLEIKESEMFGTKMGFFPSDGKNASGAIVHGKDYKPAADGVLAYLNGGNDLQQILDKVVSNHGKVIVPKTHISNEVGLSEYSSTLKEIRWPFIQSIKRWKDRPLTS